MVTLGLDKILISPDSDITVTNDGATILDQMNVQHQVAKLLVQLSKSRDDEVGDSTTGVVGKSMITIYSLCGDNVWRLFIPMHSSLTRAILLVFLDLVMARAFLEQAKHLLVAFIRSVLLTVSNVLAGLLSHIWTRSPTLSTFQRRTPRTFTRQPRPTWEARCKSNGSIRSYIETTRWTVTDNNSQSICSSSVSKCQYAKFAVDAILQVADLERKDVDFELIKVDGKVGGSLADTVIEGVIIDKAFISPSSAT